MNNCILYLINKSFLLFYIFQTALSIFFQEAAIPPCGQGPGGTHFGQVSLVSFVIYLRSNLKSVLFFSSKTIMPTDK